MKGLAREAGSRTKIAITSTDPHVDPVGALVGQRGVRVSTVMGALGGERIDIIEWSEDMVAYIKESLNPATVIEVVLDEADHRATVTVSEDQQSLAIGRGGQNVRLAAKLTGWNIDIMSVGGEAVAEADADVSLRPDQTPSEATLDEKATEGASEMQEAMTDPDSETVADADTVGTESIITPDAADEATGELSMEEETGFTDNGTVSDSEESRDESGATIKDQS